MAIDICPHGHLRRQCETCDLLAERDDLAVQHNALLGLWNGQQEAFAQMKAEVERLTRERDEARAERDDLQATFDDANVQAQAKLAEVMRAMAATQKDIIDANAALVKAFPVGAPDSPPLAVRIRALAAERDRLRAALEMAERVLAEVTTAGCKRDYPNLWSVRNGILMHVRAVLADCPRQRALGGE